MSQYVLTGPLPLAPGKTSPFFEFSSYGEPQMFLRAVALWTDNTPPPRPDPIFQLRAPGGIFTDVRADGTAVVVTGEEEQSGTATCVPEDGGIFLVTVVIDGGIFAPVNPWHIRIVNNAGRDLRFVTVSAVNEPATRQPWIVIGDPPTDIAPASATMDFDEPSDGEYLKVSNWGTGDLTLLDEIGQPVGGGDSPFVLVHRPAVVVPHGVDHMIIRCDAAGVATDVAFRFESNDDRVEHGLINIRVG